MGRKPIKPNSGRRAMEGVMEGDIRGLGAVSNEGEGISEEGEEETIDIFRAWLEDQAQAGADPARGL